MSSDQYSEKPLPAGKKRCQHCGEPVSRRGKVCWLCRQKWTQQSPSDRHAPPAPLIKKSDNSAWLALGILGAILAGGLLFEGPGMLVVVAILVLLAILNSAGATELEKKHARLMKESDGSPDTPADEDHESESIVAATSRNAASGCAMGLVLSVVFFATFFATCTAVMFGGFTVASAFGAESQAIVVVLLLCVGGGFLAAIVVTSSLGRRMSAKKGGS
jgi:hypothetical protein